jgi:hypothetical protein
MLSIYRMRLPVYCLFTPLYGLRTSRSVGVMLLLLALRERDLHPHDDSVIEVLSSPSVPEGDASFRMNESHTVPITRRRQLQTLNKRTLGGRVHGRC